MLVEFVIKNKFFSLTLEEFGQILRIPIEGQCSFSDKWSLDNLEFSVPKSGLYHTTPPTPDDIKLYVQVEMEEFLTRQMYVYLSTYQLPNCQYVLHDRVMLPLTPHYERKRRKDYGTKRDRPSTSTSSAFDHPSSSHYVDEDNNENDEGTSHANTVSPTRFVNSLLDDVAQVFSNLPHDDPDMEAFFTRQTKFETVKFNYEMSTGAG
ncbi:hypothetical protein Tco_0382282 [Tanacetum coccineum]